MSNKPNEIDKALAAAGLPPLRECAEAYSHCCYEQFAPLFLGGVNPLVAFAVTLEALKGLTASLLLTMQVSFPDIDSTGRGLEAFIADLRNAVARGPKTMEEMEWLEAEMEP